MDLDNFVIGILGSGSPLEKRIAGIILSCLIYSSKLGHVNTPNHSCSKGSPKAIIHIYQGWGAIVSFIYVC